MAIKKNHGWNFDNSYTHLPERLFTEQKPARVPLPKLIILNKPLAESMGLDVNKLKSEEWAEVFAGNFIPAGAFPISQAYAGHQFGHFTMLGDGRAVLLGEQITPKGERLDVQFKGSGKTPYSRGGDGRAALGPMLREYIISEALHNLGIPTTRSLAVVTTGEQVVRETLLAGAILTRVASSHIRVGTFQYVLAYGSARELKQLADYTIQRHFPDIATEENKYLLLIREVIKGQALLISKWQLVGFIHGVMNTDNMAISGEAMDFGPCAFMDAYDPSTVFSSIDTQGRYAYGNQPDIAAWNLARFAEALLPLIHDDQEEAASLVNEELVKFFEIYKHYWLNGMRKKLGLFNEEPGHEALIMELLDLMQKYEADFTNTFRKLTVGRLDGMEIFNTVEFSKWHEKWEAIRGKQKKLKTELRQLMQSHNPSVIPRNHRVEEALKAATENNDFSVMERLNDILSNPFEYSPKQEEYSSLPPASRRPYRTFCGT